MKDLAKSSKNTLSLAKTSDSVSLLRAKPMILQIQEYGENVVLSEIRTFVEKCAMGLDIPFDNMRMAILCEDILEVYSGDSLEDVRDCMKKARQGRYGFGFNKRGAITMELIAEWMGKHLEEKAKLREKLIHNRKFKESDETPTIATDEMAKKYLSQMKQIVANVRDRQTKSSPVVDHSNFDTMSQVMKTDNQTIKSFKECMKKIEEGKDLTENEKVFLRSWKVAV